MNFLDQIELNCQLLESPLYRRKNIKVTLVRADQVHRHISGNKWYKLKYALLAAKQKNIRQLISFGGAYSNHIHALAYAANQLQIPVLGFIRGEWTEDNLTLKDAKSWGMSLQSLTRSQYREKSSPEFLQQLALAYPNSMVIAEGGSGRLALKGVAELMAAIEQQLPYLNHLVAACGTGGTLAGLIGSASSTYSILGVPVLKGGGFLEADIKALLRQAAISEKCQWRLDLEGHYGGYGKVKTAHLEAMQRIESEHNVELEPIYTAKMWRRFDELVQADYFTAGDSIALLHSGGVQGRRSFKLMGIKE